MPAHAAGDADLCTNTIKRACELKLCSTCNYNNDDVFVYDITDTRFDCICCDSRTRRERSTLAHMAGDIIIDKIKSIFHSETKRNFNVKNV